MRKNTGGPATVLFLGSRTGSLFRRPSLADLLKGFSEHDVLNMAPVERFRECYKILESFKKQNQESDIHFIIREALKEKQIEVADLCIVELLKQGIFDCIITTNIGSELERALHRIDMEESRDFEVIVPEHGKSLAGRMTKSHLFKMIKASGDIVSGRYSICGYNIDSKELFLNKYPKLKTTVEQFKEEDMLMVGFDDKWDKHIIPAIFPRKAGSLWYVNEEQTPEDSLLFSYLQDYEAKRFEDTTGGYELFFTNLCLHTLGFIPTNQLTTKQLTSKHEGRNEIRDTQHKLQNDLGYLKETVNKLLHSQEATTKDIKEDIKGLRTKVNILLKHPISPVFSSSPSGSISSLQKRKRRSIRKTTQFEENGK